MDDIAFFDSSSYSRRGGIWPEAGRREKPSVSTIPSATDDDVPATAVPPEVDPSSLLTPSDPDKGFHTDGDVKVEANHSPIPPPLPHRAATPSASRGSSPTPTHSLNHDRLSSANGADPHAETPDLLTEVTPLDAHRPPLRHHSSSSSEKSKKKRFLGVRRTSRSPSPSLASNSSSRELSPAPSLEKLRNSSPEPLSGRSSGRSSPATVRLSKSPTITSQSSLLSTLKSRAGDRQALSSTARETMRKWTVSWGGLKKDRDQNAASPEDARDGGRDAMASQKVKSNYADIRAAVDGRRDKERRKSDVPATPIPIPDRGHKGRADSISSLNGRQGSSFSSQAESSPASSFVEGSVEPPPADEPTLPEQSSKQLPTIDVDGAQIDLEDTTETDSTPVTAVPPPVPVPPRPIQSQPSQGKTMTIPSIHARNRGEVMSMGYVPPSPTAAVEAKTGVSSVYRLWKHAPAAQSEPASQDDEQARSGSPPAVTADGAETTMPVSPPATAAAAPAPAPKPSAPPLPPRSPTSLRPVPRVPSSSSPASEALMSIVSRDELCRAGSEGAQRDDGNESGDGTTTLTPNPPAPAGPKPPLPARKIHASA